MTRIPLLGTSKDHSVSLWNVLGCRVFSTRYFSDRCGRGVSVTNGDLRFGRHKPGAEHALIIGHPVACLVTGVPVTVEYSLPSVNISVSHTVAPALAPARVHSGVRSRLIVGVTDVGDGRLLLFVECAVSVSSFD